MGTTYVDFNWSNKEAANGRSGVGLADSFIDVVIKLTNVKRVCDLGCGNGYMAGRLTDLDYEVTGVDASETGISIARANHPDAEFVCSPFDSILGKRDDLKDFDLVISSDVIEHLYRPADLMKQACTLLRAGGHLVVGTPYHGYLKNLALGLPGKMDSHFNVLDEGGHIKFFSVKTLSALLRQHGFIESRV